MTAHESLREELGSTELAKWNMPSDNDRRLHEAHLLAFREGIPFKDALAQIDREAENAEK